MLTTVMGAVLVAGASHGSAAISLLPAQWNMIQNGSYTTNADGSGYHSFAGGGKEALLEFDLSSIPGNATITSAVLTMYMDRSSASTAQPIFVYRLTSSWGMGTSGAGQSDNGSSNGGGGMGYSATNNDATWYDRFYNATTPASSTMWTTPGGDYVSTDSAYTLVQPVGSQTAVQSTWSGTGLVSDVQGWLNGSEANDGWILNDYASATDYPSGGSAFGSDAGHRFVMPANNENGTSGTTDYRPYLTLTYTVPEPASMGLLVIGGLMLGARRRRD